MLPEDSVVVAGAALAVLHTPKLSPVNRLWSATYVPFITSEDVVFYKQFCQLPWSTANEDLVELFETTGQVELAEILFDGTRSKGAGVVQFAQVAEAETAIGTPCPILVPL